MVSTESALWLYTTTFEKQLGSSQAQTRQFDSDSQTPMVDDGASACITNDKNDFVGTPKTISRKVNGINGQAQATLSETVRWLIRRSWRVKGDAECKTKIATQPGQVVSVDQLESSTLGFVAQLEGILTTQRYKYALIFIDQYSNLTFVFQQKRLTSEETVLTKKTFER